MQKITLLLLCFMAAFATSAQETSNEIWSDRTSGEQKNIFQQADEVASASRSKKPSKEIDDPNLLTAPIDGGVSALLVVGALYGRRRWKQARKKG